MQLSEQCTDGKACELQQCEITKLNPDLHLDVLPVQMKITYAYPRFTFEAHLILNAVVPKEWYVGHLAKSDIESRHNFEDKMEEQIFWRGRAEPACL